MLSDVFGAKDIHSTTDTMEKEEARVISLPQPPKYSRYRSVRNAAAAKVPSPSPKPLHSQSIDGVGRSVSRYKKPRAATAPSGSEPVPIVKKAYLPQGSSPANDNGITSSIQDLETESSSGTEDYTSEDVKPRLSNKAQQEAYDILNGRSPHARTPAHSKTSGTESKDKYQKRPEISKIKTNQSYDSSTSGSTSAKVNNASMLSDPPTSRLKKEPVHPSAGSTVLQPAILGFDAPKSAINAGIRQVVVQCYEASISLPITLTSTPTDVLSSASEALCQKIDPSSHILLESFKQVGLERPLRHYEHIREVMNSWDRDDQNTLLIIPASTEGKDDHLEIQSVPRAQPGETSVGIYHSQKPGVWEKRWATLRSDGQVLVAKQKGTEGRNICHISDFDIYMPTSRQLKKLKPPRKYCFAIKSQQKSAMFLNTVNFVHFFATKDRAVASAWYQAVQGWRSWYLVHEMGLGQGTGSVKNSSTNISNHQRTASTASTPHHVRPTKPHFSEGFSGPDPTIVTSPTSIYTTGKGSPLHHFNNRGGPPLSYPRKLTKDSTTGAATTRNRGQSVIQIQRSGLQATEDPFLADGLLGKAYGHRQRALQAELDAQEDNSPSQSTNSNFKPLVELPPRDANPGLQHLQKSHGFTLDQVPANGLIDAVTNPEKASIAPPATTGHVWQPSIDRQQQMPGSVRRKTGDEQDQPTEPAFTGRGLLARAEDGQGGRRQGKGVACGDRAATEPLLELERERAFAQGSLLESVERMRGEEERGPVIERAKVREVFTRTGEAR